LVAGDAAEHHSDGSLVDSGVANADSQSQAAFEEAAAVSAMAIDDSNSIDSGSESESCASSGAAASVPGGLTEYELERQRKIDENNKMLAALGLLGPGSGRLIGTAQVGSQSEGRAPRHLSYRGVGGVPAN
jgi:hypothetical protein